MCCNPLWPMQHLLHNQQAFVFPTLRRVRIRKPIWEWERERAAKKGRQREVLQLRRPHDTHTYMFVYINMYIESTQKVRGFTIPVCLQPYSLRLKCCSTTLWCTHKPVNKCYLLLLLHSTHTQTEATAAREKSLSLLYVHREDIEWARQSQRERKSEKEGETKSGQQTMYENTFFRKVYWTGSWSTSRWFCACEMRQQCACEMPRNAPETRLKCLPRLEASISSAPSLC